MNNNKLFNLHELPSAYFSENIKANSLRKNIIKNQVKISDCGQSNLEIYFFSDENIDIINKQLILTVYHKSDKLYKINKQPNESLVIVMRYVFLEYAKHLPYKIREQICELNKIVINEILPNVFTNITQKIEYLKVINSERKLLDLPKNVNHKTVLPSISNIYFDY